MNEISLFNCLQREFERRVEGREEGEIKVSGCDPRMSREIMADSDDRGFERTF